MHGFLDEALVAVVLVASFGYALFALGPRAIKQTLLARSAALLRLAPTKLRLQGLAARWEAAASNKAAGACGGCDNCGSEPAKSAPGSAAEIKIPLSKIGKRS
jgi:hypothetical protein